MRSILVKRLSMRGFIISDGFEHRRAEFLETMSAWLRAGKIKYREDVVRGLENAPGAFLGLLAGRNFGKLVVEVAGPARPEPRVEFRFRSIRSRPAARRTDGRGGSPDGRRGHPGNRI